MESSVFLSDLLTAHEPELHKSLQCRQATFRFMGRPLSFFACIGTMNYPLTRPSGILSPRRGRGMGGRGRFMERFPRKISRIEPLNLVGTARCAVRAAFSGATMPPAASRAGTSQRDVPTKVRFMGREEPQVSKYDHKKSVRIQTRLAHPAAARRSVCPVALADGQHDMVERPARPAQDLDCQQA